MNHEDIFQYCIEHSTEESPLLSGLRRATHLRTLSPGMLSGPLQGNILTMLTKMKDPKRVLEIGTFTGYATLCIAAGLSDVGRVDTLEIDEELVYFYERFFSGSGYGDKINVILGDATESMKSLDLAYDMVFMDAGKKDYLLQYEMLMEQMPVGGIILTDNVLWKGKVVEERKDSITTSLHEFNLKIAKDDRVENVILPIRDGINVIRKK